MLVVRPWIVLLIFWPCNLFVCSQDVRPVLTEQNVPELGRLAYSTKDWSVKGNGELPAQMVVSERITSKVFDAKTNGFRQSTKYKYQLVDDTSLKIIRSLHDSLALVSVSDDGKKRLWSRKDRFVVEGKRQVEFALNGFDPSIAGMAFHPSRDWVAINVWDRSPEEEGCIIGFSKVRIYTLDGMQVREFEPNQGAGAWLKFSPDGNYLLIGSQSMKKVLVLKASSGEIVYSITGDADIHDGNWHPEGNLFSVCNSKSCQILSLQNKKIVHELEFDSINQNSKVLWGKNGDLLIVAADGKMAFLETRTWSKIHEVKLFYEGIVSLSSSFDGARIFTRSGSLKKYNPNARALESWGIR